jgi:hypothetical protein
MSEAAVFRANLVSVFMDRGSDVWIGCHVAP